MVSDAHGPHKIAASIPLTSQASTTSVAIAVKDYHLANLHEPSVAQVYRIMPTPATSLLRCVGELSERDNVAVTGGLRKLLKL